MIVCLVNIGLSTPELQAVLKVGGCRFILIMNLENLGTPVYEQNTQPFNKVTVKSFSEFMGTLEKKDRFPCAHRCPKQYIISSEGKKFWSDYYVDYCKFVEDKQNVDIKIMAFTKFHEYRGWLYPGHTTSCKVVEISDHCIRLKLIISSRISTDHEKILQKMN